MRVILIVVAVLAAAGCGSSGSNVSTGEILFSRSADSGSRTDVYSMHADGSRARLFLRNAAYPAASRDGRSVAFARNGAIWTVRRDGATARQITAPPPRVHDFEPAWSADGKTVFFSRLKEPEGGYQSVFSVRRDGSHVRRLTYSDVEWDCAQMEPAPSADGEIIGYTVYCDRGASASIDAMSPSGRGRDLAFNLGDSFYYEYGPDWSPDGSSLAFAGEHSDEYGAAPADLGSRLAIYVASRANAPSAVARPTTQTDSLGDPAWSPDGVWIAFTRLPDATVNPTTASEIWLVHPDGSGLRRLTDGTPLDGHPAWLPPVRARESGR